MNTREITIEQGNLTINVGNLSLSNVGSFVNAFDYQVGGASISTIYGRMANVNTWALNNFFPATIYTNSIGSLSAGSAGSGDLRIVASGTDRIVMNTREITIEQGNLTMNVGNLSLSNVGSFVNAFDYQVNGTSISTLYGGLTTANEWTALQTFTGNLRTNHIVSINEISNLAISAGSNTSANVSLNNNNAGTGGIIMNAGSESTSGVTVANGNVVLSTGNILLNGVSSYVNASDYRVGGVSITNLYGRLATTNTWGADQTFNARVLTNSISSTNGTSDIYIASGTNTSADVYLNANNTGDGTVIINSGSLNATPVLIRNGDLTISRGGIIINPENAPNSIGGVVVSNGNVTVSSGNVFVGQTLGVSGATSVGGTLTVGGVGEFASGIRYKSSICGYLVNGPKGSQQNLFPIPSSINSIGNGANDTDDAWIVNPGYKFRIYADVGYTGTSFEYDNETGTRPVIFWNSDNNNSNNTANSVKVYYLNNEEMILNGISTAV